MIDFDFLLITWHAWQVLLTSLEGFPTNHAIFVKSFFESFHFAMYSSFAIPIIVYYILTPRKHEHLQQLQG